jgi:hypothetical protein
VLTGLAAVLEGEQASSDWARGITAPPRAARSRRAA